MSNTGLLVVVVLLIAVALLLITTPPADYCDDTTLSHFDIDEYASAKAILFTVLYLLYARPSSPVLSSMKTELKDRLHSIREGYLQHHPNSKVPSMIEGLMQDALYQAQQGWVISLPSQRLQSLGDELAKDKKVPSQPPHLYDAYLNQIEETASHISQVSDHLFRREYNRANRLWSSKVEGRYFLKIK